MKPPPTARDLAGSVLLEEERKGTRIRDLLQAARAGLSDPRERGLLTELAYGVVRRRGTLDALIARLSRWPLARLSAAARTAIRLALYQILFLDRVPAHAAVNHAVTWVKRQGGAKAAGFVNGVLRAATRLVEGPAVGPEAPRRDVPREDGGAVRLHEDVFPDPAEDLAGNLAARFAAPTWLVQRWLGARGPERTRALLQAGIGRPPLTLRARDDAAALLARLLAAGAAAEAGPVAGAVQVAGQGEAAALAEVERGAAWVQDATAQRVAPLVGASKGARVLDLCAAPGGKTLHLADLMGEGEVVAADVDADKIRTLEALAPRMPPGVRLEVVRVEPEGPLPFADASFDAVLVDAPCTNSGVLRRRVEARWRLAPDDVASLARLQRALLERAERLVRPGGRLVYATCSLEPEEDGEVVDAFLAAHPGWREVERLDVPAGRDADGGFAAVLERA